MDSTVKSRPNHYETLGLEPTATSAEIEQAFTRELRRPRAFGGVAHLSIAYETVRDPAKRRAYDASIGIMPESQPQPQPAVGHWLTARAVAAPVRVRRAPTDPVKQPAEPLPPPAPPVKVEAESQPSAEPKLPSFLAASLREPVRPEPRHDIASAPRRQPEPPRRTHVELRPGGDRLARYTEEAGPAYAEGGSIPWKRTAMGVGALVAAVGLFGAWAGWEAGNDIETQPPERAVKVALPPAKPRETSAASAAAPVPRVEQEARLRPAARPVVAATAIEPASTPPAAASEQQPSEFARVAQSPGLDTAVETLATEAPAPAPVAASLGLPNRVVARTIERIGYSCGDVASTTAVDGASGVFKVTCTSGSSYQARPVGGRYRFRRWGRQ